jgi:predicted PurR-regulated permease PerM
MTSRIITNGIVKAVAIIALFCVVLYFLYSIQIVFVYISIAIVLSLMGNPIVEFLRNRLKFSNTLAVCTTLLFFVALLAGLIMMFVPMLISQGNNLSLLDTKSIEEKLITLYNELGIYLGKHNIDIDQVFKKSELTSSLNFNWLTNFFNSVLGTISSLGIGIAATLFITFFFLKDKVYFIVGVKKVLPDSTEPQILSSIEKIRSLLTRYFVGLLTQLVIIYILYIIVLLIFGIENAVIIAFLCALLNIIPYIGPLIASVLAAILSLLAHMDGDFQNEAIPTMIYVLIGFSVVQFIDNNISSPLIFSKSVNSHPLEIFLVILIAGILFGVAGMIIAVPSYTILKVIGKEFFPENKIIRVLTKNI